MLFQIPIYQGGLEPLIPHGQDYPLFHGEDGFGDLQYDTEPDISIIQKEPAIVATHRIVKENPGEISLVCLGPLTNVALAIKVYDDFACNVKEVFLMGGNYTGE